MLTQLKRGPFVLLIQEKRPSLQVMSCFSCVSSVHANFINQHTGHLPEVHLFILLTMGKMCHYERLHNKEKTASCLLYFARLASSFFKPNSNENSANCNIISAEARKENSFLTLLIATLKQPCSDMQNCWWDFCLHMG